MMLSIFSCAFWPFVCLRRNVYLDLPILWLGCLFDIELHELFVYFGGESLLVASFATIFSHSENCLFILFVVSFAVQKLFSLVSPIYLFLFLFSLLQFSSVQSLSHVQLFAITWTAAHQASLSTTNSWSLLKLMSIELVMPSNHLILYHLLLLPPSVLPSIRVFLLL